MANMVCDEGVVVYVPLWTWNPLAWRGCSMNSSEVLNVGRRARLGETDTEMCNFHVQ